MLKDQTLGWSCFKTLSLCTEPLNLEDTATALFTVLCVRQEEMVGEAAPFGMHAMDDDADVDDVGRLGT